MTISIPSVKKSIDEKTIEQYLTREIAKLGGTAYKFNSEQHRGVPDRLCVLPNRLVLFVECKRPGKEPTLSQFKEIERLRAKCHFATWVSTKEEVDYLTKCIFVCDTAMLSYKDLREDQR